MSHIGIWLEINISATCSIFFIGSTLGKVCLIDALSSGPGSSVGIATSYGLDCPGVGEIFPICPDWPWGPPSLLYNGYQVFAGGVKSGWGVMLTPTPF
jgi:hypothetical protein